MAASRKQRRKIAKQQARKPIKLTNVQNLRIETLQITTNEQTTTPEQQPTINNDNKNNEHNASLDDKTHLTTNTHPLGATRTNAMG